MKYILLFALSAWSLHSFGQSPITLSRADFPYPTASSTLPDSTLYTNVPIAGNTVNTSLTGASTSWSMNPLSGGTTAYQTFLPMSATPFIFQATFFGSDFVQPLLGNLAVAGLPVSDAYEYYNYAGTGSTRLEIKGFGANITIPGQTVAVPLPAIYTSPDVLYLFPIMFGNTDSSTSGFSVTIPSIATIKRNQKRVNVVDGWGSITTPAGTFDVLRVMSSIDRVDSIIVSGFPIGVASKPIEYKWLGQTKKVPVFQVNATNAAGTITATGITFWGQGPSAASTLSSTESIGIFPNPTTDNCSIQFELKNKSDISIRVIDLKAEQVAQFHFKNMSAGSHTELLPISMLARGTYIMQCSNGAQVISSKIVKY